MKIHMVFVKGIRIPTLECMFGGRVMKAPKTNE